MGKKNQERVTRRVVTRMSPPFTVQDIIEFADKLRGRPPEESVLVYGNGRMEHWHDAEDQPGPEIVTVEDAHEAVIEGHLYAAEEPNRRVLLQFDRPDSAREGFNLERNRVCAYWDDIRKISSNGVLVLDNGSTIRFGYEADRRGRTWDLVLLVRSVGE